MSAPELIEHVLQLPTADRAEVAAEILFSLHPDESVEVDDQAWMAEIQSRREQVLSGQTAMRNWSDVRAEMLEELSQSRTA